MDRIKGDKDGKLTLAPVLLVDGDTITSDAKSLENVVVSAEVIENLRGPKIVIQKFKNKTGYKKRQGHRQELTRVKVTGIK
jgi:large subunit ribosomal protein L21